MLEVRMIGTGSAFSKKYSNTSALLTFPDQYRLLIDCGHTVPKALYKYDNGIEDLDGILITHLHADHVAGLEEVALYCMYVLNGRKLDLFVPAALLPGIWSDCLKAGLSPGGFKLTDYFNLRPLFYGLKNKKSINGVPIELFETKHVEGMVSYAVGVGNRLFYSGDTVFDRKLIATAAEKYNHIFHDCQFGFTGGVHASLDELKTLPTYIKDKIWLMHYGDNMEDFRADVENMDILEEGNLYYID